MVFSKQNLFYIFLVFIFSCSPKQIDIPASQPKVTRPIWLEGISEDSLFIYGISKLEKNSQLNLDSIASNKIISVIKENFIQDRKIISDSLKVDFTVFDGVAWEKRVKELPDFFSKEERFIDDYNNYVMIKFDKNQFISNYNKELLSAIYQCEKTLDDIDDNISKENFKKIAQSFEQVIFFVGFGGTKSDYKKVSQIKNRIKAWIDNINDRLQLSFESDFLKTMPLIIEGKRVRVNVKDIKSNQPIKELWLEAFLTDYDQNDLLITKKDGSLEYQARTLTSNLNGYEITFKISYRSMLSKELVTFFALKQNDLKLSVISKNPKIYFENIINNIDNKLKDSHVIDAIKGCFEDKYFGEFINEVSSSNLSLRFDITSIENSDKISKIYPNFVHSSGSLIIKDTHSNKKIFSKKISEKMGSDFESIEKAGINSLKNLAKEVTLKICG
ncbi:MAG: hypothetical protein ACJZ19_03960 [Candidatus Neomarinimicrobiota bacterium]